MIRWLLTTLALLTTFLLPLGAHTAGLEARHWVLWIQFSDSRNHLPIAVSAWPTQAACDRDRAVRQARQKTTVGLSLTCLPDTIHLRCH